MPVIQPTIKVEDESVEGYLSQDYVSDSRYDISYFPSVTGTGSSSSGYGYYMLTNTDVVKKQRINDGVLEDFGYGWVYGTVNSSSTSNMYKATFTLPDYVVFNGSRLGLSTVLTDDTAEYRGTVIFLCGRCTGFGSSSSGGMSFAVETAIMKHEDNEWRIYFDHAGDTLVTPSRGTGSQTVYVLPLIMSKV